MAAFVAPLDHAQAGFFSALTAVAQRRRLADVISIPPFGQQSTVAEGLSWGSFMNESFHPEELDLLRAALDALSLSMTSDNKGENAVKIFEKLKASDIR